MASYNQKPDAEDAPLTEEELEKALCVLAGSDPENCSYPMGYVKRQAVFACKTCSNDSAEPAGVCLACANKCHDGHDIFELYTKRNFRCDCGNGKFGDFQCQLFPAKDDQNVKNLYNHNFNGCYCICDKPYPDTDTQDEDEMIQCVICEDWFHSEHLGCPSLEPKELQEMVCEACMNNSPFLWTYAAHFAVPLVAKNNKSNEEAEVVDVERDNSEPSPSRDEESSPSNQEDELKSPSHKRTHLESTSSSLKGKAKAGECRLKELQREGLERQTQGAVFWPYSWRQELCTCTSCKRAYVAAGIQFLMDQSDTILAYEQKGLIEPFGQSPLLGLMNSMGRVQQLEVIYGIHEMTASIHEFLDKCASEEKPVTVEGVHEVFEELRAKKRRRFDEDYQ